MSRVAEAVEKVKAGGHDLWIGGPASPAAILELGKELDVELPDTLKAFLSEYGAIGIDDDFISGIVDNEPLAMQAGGIYADTIFMRQDFPDMPAGLWVIKKHEDGAYCMDAGRPSASGELAIVNYEFESHQHEKRIASSFEEFLCEWFLESWADEPA